ncbi:beta-ketoacyl synthase N-terminal-like domain-containing protein [uncultured Thermanaerothrix sp.]|uniref:thiolase C-terminal domain-containing protein n=1 Tax=uncultured Thermanaerothrix sp. TaxID=1195149 RepID=UPI002614BF1B|nr:beta-ketoacyl synthase N-terminal-like domain-containing protein [uncultured Thermanaerothrix sp.]
MREVVIAGIGMTPVGEHWDISLRSLAYRAIRAARQDAGGLQPQALYLGNFLAIDSSHQANLACLIADNAGLGGIEAMTVEAADASGAAAFHVGYLAVASGLVDVALVVGVEKYTDALGPEQESAVAQAMDYDYEVMQGLTLAAQAALVMQRYLYEYRPPREAFAAFPLLAHANAVTNPYAMYRRAVTPEAYARAEIIADPLRLLDMAPYADGAAAVVLTTPERVRDLPHPLVAVRGSIGAIDTLALHDRPDPLAFEAAYHSVQRACEMAGIAPGEVDLFELDDAFSIYAVLSLEAAGFAERGQGWRLAEQEALGLRGRLPILTLGGSKARGNPLGATGVYQVVEAALQLRGEAGANQVPHARRALVQNLAGPASSAFTHVLERYAV